MNLDPRTIVLITILSVLLTGGGLMAVSRGYLGQVRGTSEWAKATLLQALGWITVGALRGVLPDLVSIVAGNGLMLASLAWYLAILARFVDRRVHAFWVYGVAASGVGALAYFAQASPNLTARNIVISACVAALALKSAEVLWSGAAARRASHLFMAAILTLCGVFMALRAVVYLVWNPDPGSVAFAMNTINQISLLVFYVVAVLLTFGFILMCNDAYIAQQHQAEQALRASEEKFAKAFQSSPMFISISTLADGRYIEVNQGFLRALGRTRAEVIGHTSGDIGLWKNPGDRQRAIESLRQNHGVSGFEAELCKKSGESMVCEIWGDPIEINGAACIIWVTHDVSGRKRTESARASLEAQLRESQRMEAIGTLAGGIAHDFNNIIATILGNMELARQDVRGDPGRALESLQEIEKTGLRARDLVQQILSFSRREPATRRPIALASVVNESARLLRATLPARIALEVACQADVPDVLADATQIEQVPINLATNSMQALHGAPGRITFLLDTVLLDTALAEAQPELHAMLARYPGTTVRLRVSDDGNGMDAASMERIFEPFFTTKPMGEGTGLGLAVVRGIVQAHEGVIVAASAPGQGATFTIYLPVAGAEMGAMPDGSAISPVSTDAPTPGLDRARHIIYLDDDEALVFLVKRLLERRGYRVSAFGNQRAALDALRADPAAVDLMLTDYNMPGMSGLDVARVALTIHADLPVAIASASSTKHCAARPQVRECVS